MDAALPPPLGAVAGLSPVLLGFLGGVVIALLNLLGALLVLPWRVPSPRLLNGALGFAAGVMLTASFTSLILPGVERGGIGPVVAGLALGVAALLLADPAPAPRTARGGS